jgi:DNA invertase Pin-like site-specific DNA recombinase
MLEDAVAGKFDFIITKEISRFARNTLDSIHYTRELLSKGVAVYFENDNINTLDEDSEFRLTIMAGVAQDEIRKLSSRIKFGHKQAIKNGVVMGNSRIYGYEKDNGRLVINEYEAEMVRLIFELYATGESSTPKIEKLLWEKGYRNYKGGKINRNVIGHIIKNPKYKGFYVGNKVKIVNMFTKEQKFLSEDDWVMWKDDCGDTVPAIVSEEIWQKANACFNERSANMKSRNCSYKSNNLFTGKIYCAEHNEPYYLKARKNRKGENSGTWVCRHKSLNGANSCKSFPLKEVELIAIINEMLINACDNFDEITDTYIRFFNESQETNTDISQQIASIESDISRINAKKDKLLDLNLDGKINNAEFGRRNDKLNRELITLENKKRDLTVATTTTRDYLSEVKYLRNKISSYLVNGNLELTQASINDMIERIYIDTIDKYCADVKIVLKIGTEHNFSYKRAETRLNAVGCPVNTFKKMIEAQEKQMAGK